MKVLVNGGLNLSELDGWWVEAYRPEVGWALGDGQEHGDDPAWDAVEANALYDLLEREVIPEFYSRDPNGLPTAWIKRIRESMASLTPRFSADRAVREYTERYYLPAAARYRGRAKDQGLIGSQSIGWKHRLEQTWDALQFGEVKVETKNDRHLFQIQVDLENLDPESVRVQLCSEPGAGTGAVTQEMSLTGPVAGHPGQYVYSGSVPAARPSTDYTARLIPRREGVAVPLEYGRVLWQR
jgi:starch phosphorylase